MIDRAGKEGLCPLDLPLVWNLGDWIGAIDQIPSPLSGWRRPCGLGLVNPNGEAWRNECRGPWGCGFGGCGCVSLCSARRQP